MSEKAAGFAGPIEALRAWREWITKSEREWSEAMTRTMKEDTTARAVGQELTAALYAHQMVRQGMAGSLASMNLPTQDQIAALGERLGTLEDAVARVESGLVQLRHALVETAGKQVRDRKAAALAPSGDTAAPATAPKARSVRGRRS